MKYLHTIEDLTMDRRTFLKVSSAAGVSALLGTYYVDIVKALVESGRNIIWLNGAGCTGCTMSFLNAEEPDVIQAVTQLDVMVRYQETVMLQQGLFLDGQPVTNTALNANFALERFLDSGEPFILVVEGGVPLGPDGTGNYLKIAGKPFVDDVRHIAENALMTVAVGSCASYGGIPAAQPNPTDVVGLQFSGTTIGGALGADYRSGAGLPVINIPGCPAHPDWILLTLSAAILDKIPADFLDEYQRPKIFFLPGHTIHENCPRRGFYDLGELDHDYANGNCLWKLGCRGMISHSDCALRLWNDKQNMCTQAGAPCIGCVEPTFPEGSFADEIEGIPRLANVDLGNVAKVAIGAAGVGIAAHAGHQVISKEK